MNFKIYTFFVLIHLFLLKTQALNALTLNFYKWIYNISIQFWALT